MFFGTVFGILASVLTLSTVGWYTVFLDEKQNITPELDVWFLISYALWVSFVLMSYVLIGIWFVFLDGNDVSRVEGQMSNLIPWKGNHIWIAFVFGFVVFVALTLVVGRTSLKLPREMTSMKLRNSFLPRASSRDSVTMNYVKGFLMSFASVSVFTALATITLSSTGDRT